MQRLEFRSDPQLASETLGLTDKRLEITGGVGANKHRFVDLTVLDPEFEKITRRLKRFYLVPLFFSGVFGVLSWRMFPSEESMPRSIVCGIAAFMSLFMPLLMRVEPVESARFRDTKGDIVFELIQPLKDAYKYDEFVTELVRRIRVCQGVIQE